MYDNEFNAALQAIAESVNEAQFDAIIEGASALIESYDLPMDEAVATSAAALFNEDVIDAGSYSVTSAVMDEFANRPVSWDEALGFIAEAVGEEQFDAIMSENVAGMLDALSEAGGFTGDLKKLGNAADTAYGKGRNAVLAGGKKAIAGGKKAGKFVAKVTGGARIARGIGELKSARELAKKGKDYNSDSLRSAVKATMGSGVKHIAQGAGNAAVIGAVGAGAARLAKNAKEGDALKDIKALKNAAQKKLDDLKTKKVEAPEEQEKLGESAGVYTLADMRAMVQG